MIGDPIMIGLGILPNHLQRNPFFSVKKKTQRIVLAAVGQRFFFELKIDLVI